MNKTTIIRKFNSSVINREREREREIERKSVLR